MSRTPRAFLFLLAFLLMIGGACPAQDRITLKDDKEVSGQITAHDENGITLKSENGGEKKYRWEDMVPKSAYGLMRQYVDPNKASAHLALGLYCMAGGLIEEAKSEFSKCCELDSSYRAQIKEAFPSLELPTPGKDEAEKKPAPEVQPTMTSEDVLAAQRQSARKVNEKLGTNLKTSETPHFIIHSDFTSASDMATIRKWCETLYERMSDVLDVKPGDPLWLGKCEVFLFLSRDDFVRFAKTIDKFPEANVSGGYTKMNDRICRIVIPKSGSRAKETFLFTLLHEGAHAFFQLSGNVVEIKPWLHEGLAQYFELVLPHGAAEDREAHFRMAKRIISKPGFTRFSELRALDQILGSDTEAYFLSWSIVDFLITTDRGNKRFAKFIRLIKAGKKDDEAMKEAFNQTPEQIEQSWLRYVRSRR